MKIKTLTIRIAALLVVGGGIAWAQVARADDAPAPTTNWNGNVSFGLSLARGNANTFLMNAGALAQRSWGQNELKFNADGQYGLNNWGQTNQDQSANMIHGAADYKRLFTPRFYGDLNIDGTHDDLSSIQYRMIVGPAAGYYFIKSDATKMFLEVGPSLIEERLGHEDTGYFTLRVTERAEHALTKTSKIWEQVDFLPRVDDLSAYLLNTEIGAEAALNTRLSLRVVARDQYNSAPAAGFKDNDITLISALVYKY